MLGKFELYWFFHGLMILEKKISTSVIQIDLLGFVVEYVVFQFFQNKLVLWQKFAVFYYLLSPLILFGVRALQ